MMMAEEEEDMGETGVGETGVGHPLVAGTPDLARLHASDTRGELITCTRDIA